MPDYQFTVSITLQTPVLSQESGGRALGVDTAAVCDGGFPALPGALVKGHLREAWTRLAALAADFITPADIAAWLGDKSADGGDNAPVRSRLRFAAFWRAETPGGGDNVLYRIAKNAQTGAVERGALQVIAAPHPPGQAVVYQADIEATVKDGAEAAQLARWLRKGLEFVPALGAFKGSGYGRVLGVAVAHRAAEPKPAAAVSVADRPFNPDGFGLRLRLDRPFCFARPHTPDSNRFESESFIPGAAVKGALAETLKACGQFDGHGAFAALHRHFNRLRFTHGLPAPKGAGVRPLAIPLSLAVDGQGALHDLALKAAPGLLAGRAPAFQPDWKGRHWAAAADFLGVDEPGRVLTVRTAINSERGAAETEQLFALECVETQAHDWLLDVDLSRIPGEAERRAAGRQLRQALAAGLAPLGKTQAKAEVECLEERLLPACRSASGLRDNLAVIVLQTAARLSLPADLADVPATNGEDKMHQAYAQAWHRLSGGAWALSHYFARQRLVGGGYLKARFNRGRQPYNPELLTLPGAVFVLAAASGRAEDAERKLRDWLAHGLPQPDADSGHAEEDGWQDNPWLAVNGYGEMAVNLPLHWDLQPSHPVWQEIGS